jgi:molybdopterin-guanine dinucleotide biosynthesis protein A
LSIGEESNNKLEFHFLSSIILQSSAIILAGGFSKRLGRDKGLVLLKGKPLVLHVIDRLSIVVDEVVVVVSSEIQRKNFFKVLEGKASIFIDKTESQSPLVGAMTGFESAQGEYSLLLPCDTPLVSAQIVQFLLKMCTNRSAAIPRWPGGYIEPLQAAYHTKLTLAAAKTALAQGNMNMRSMIDNLKSVRYISTLVLKEMEPKLLTFFNINTLQDLNKAEFLLK